jgi:hypothetical protein
MHTNRRKNYDWTSRKVCGSAADSHEKPTERGVFGRDVPWIGYPSPIDYEGEHALEPPAPASGPARPSRTSPAAGPQDGPSLAAAKHDGPSVVRAGNGE